LLQSEDPVRSSAGAVRRPHGAVEREDQRQQDQHDDGKTRVHSFVSHGSDSQFICSNAGAALAPVNGSLGAYTATLSLALLTVKISMRQTRGYREGFMGLYD